MNELMNLINACEEENGSGLFQGRKLLKNQEIKMSKSKLMF